jgi:hypothetical protein
MLIPVRPREPEGGELGEDYRRGRAPRSAASSGYPTSPGRLPAIDAALDIRDERSVQTGSPTTPYFPAVTNHETVG